jgi:hypothetical protein
MNISNIKCYSFKLIAVVLMFAMFSTSSQAADSDSDRNSLEEICMANFQAGYASACLGGALQSAGGQLYRVSDLSVKNNVYKPMYAAVSALAWGGTYAGLKSLSEALSGGQLSSPYFYVPTIVGGATATAIQYVNQRYVPSPDAGKYTGRGFALALAKGTMVVGGAVTSQIITSTVMNYATSIGKGRRKLISEKDETLLTKNRYRRLLAYDAAEDKQVRTAKHMTGVMANAMDGFQGAIGMQELWRAWTNAACYYTDWDANSGPRNATSDNPTFASYCQQIANNIVPLANMYDAGLHRLNKQVEIAKNLIRLYAKTFTEIIPAFKQVRDADVNTGLGMIWFHKNSSGVVVPRQTERYLHSNQILPVGAQH